MIKAAFSLPLVQFLHFQAKQDIVAYRHMWEQGIRLKNDCNIPLLRGEFGDVPLPEQYLAVRGGRDPRDHTQQSGLAASRRPEDGDEFRLRHRHGCWVKRLSAAIGLRNVDYIELIDVGGHVRHFLRCLLFQDVGRKGIPNNARHDRAGVGDATIGIDLGRNEELLGFVRNERGIKLGLW